MSPTRNFAASPPSLPHLPPSPGTPRPPEVQEENHQGDQTGKNNLIAKNEKLTDDILKGLSYEILTKIERSWPYYCKGRCLFFEFFGDTFKFLLK